MDVGVSDLVYDPACPDTRGVTQVWPELPETRTSVDSSHVPAEYASFYLAQFRAVSRTVYLILYDREHAEDIAQDAFIQLYIHWQKVSRYESPHAWVRRVAIRLATRAARRERQGKLLARIDAVQSTEESRGGDVDLLRATASLPAQQRAAIVLFYYEDRPVSEVAEMLGCSESAAKVTLHRARRALEARLTATEPDDVH